jgi:MFS family permease
VDIDTATENAIPPQQMQPSDPKNVRRAALAGLIGTMLENYDFVIYGTASALVFGPLFFPEISPVAALMASFSAYAVGFVARPLGGFFFSHFGEKLGRKWVMVTTLFLMGGGTFAIGCIPDFRVIGAFAPVLLVLCRFLQGFGAGAEQSGGATLLTETAPLGHRGKLSSFVMVGAALGGVLGAGAWVLAQRLPDDMLMNWGWRTVFWSSLIVTIAAAVIRSKMAESPVFEELKESVDVKDQAPIKVVAKHGRKSVLRVILMNWGVSTQSYMYQVFLVGYLAAVVGVSTTFIPPVQLVASTAAAIAAFVTGWLSDRFGRRPMALVLCGILVVTPFIVFPGLNSGSRIAIIAIIILGYMVAAQGITGIHMSYLPELFGSRYRYSGVTLGREISAVIGGGIAPLLGSGLLSLFMDSWVPVAIYMALTMLVSFLATFSAPETVNRDLTILTDAQDGEQRPRARG